MITLRPSTPNDARFVDDLTRLVMGEYVRKTWQNEKDIETYFLKNRFDLSSTQIIQSNGQDIGRLSVIYAADHISLDNIHVLPAFQGKGVGKHLIKWLCEKADAMQLPVRLLVLQTNPTKKLYDDLGFEVSKIRDFRYHMERMPKAKPETA